MNGWTSHFEFQHSKFDIPAEGLNHIFEGISSYLKKQVDIKAGLETNWGTIVCS